MQYENSLSGLSAFEAADGPMKGVLAYTEDEAANRKHETGRENEKTETSRKGRKHANKVKTQHKDTKTMTAPVVNVHLR